jgi:hypothetical protein
MILINGSRSGLLAFGAAQADIGEAGSEFPEVIDH